MKITIQQFREKWFKFWESKHHRIISSAGVIPENDPTALFHNSGMHPLVPYLLGQKHPEGSRLANVQKCIRTGDIEEVGDATHLTFFEMLGNWSLGDYFKREQIEWSFEFLVNELEIPLERMAFSVFAGDSDAPRDTKAAGVWMECGIQESRIAYLGKKDNWWAKGDIGPCGPDTEMFYWTGEEPAPENFQETCSDPQWVEIWNDVFMEFDRNEKGELKPLSQKNIDTGMGLERTVAILNGYTSVYQIDTFVPIFNYIAELVGKPEIAKNPIADTENGLSARIIADHLRASVILLADRISPSNIDQGYVLRMLLRRAIRHARKLGVNNNFCASFAKVIIGTLEEAYPELNVHKQFIFQELEREEDQFRVTLEKGEKEFEKMLKKSNGKIDGEQAFYLYETYGFPFEMTQEFAKENGFSIDESVFKKALTEHQQKSRSGSEQKFAGGLGDKSEETVKFHTATHLLHSALRTVLGDHVEQRGSNITPERLRFDFSHEEKVTPEQLAEVTKIINDAIKAGADVICEEMTVEEAKEQGAIGLFGDKYEEMVKVYTIGSYSKEICGGPHVKNINVLGVFKIKKEQSASRGIRRIKAILE